MKACLKGMGAALLLCWSLASASAEDLPALPKLDLSGTFPGVQKQIREADAAARIHPNDPDANGKLGMVLDAYQQYAAAAICYRRAHLLAPSAFEWVYDLAYVQMRLGQYLPAAATFRAALQKRPDYLPAKLNLAECLLSAHQLAESRELFEAIIQGYPDQPQAYYGLGRIAAQQGNAKDAAGALEKACELFPPYGGAHYALALVYRKLGNSEKAAEQFAAYRANVAAVPPSVDPLRAAVQKLDQAPLTYVQRGVELEQAGKLPEAIEAHQKAVELDPGFVEAHAHLIQLYARAGEYDKAEQEYHTALRLNSRCADCEYDYGVLMYRLGRYEPAEQAFRRALQADPQHAQAHNNLGFLLEGQGHLDEALEEFRKAVEAQPDYRLARFHIGQILVSRGDYAGAIEQFRKTLVPEDAETPTYLYALGSTYARAGDLRNALVYLRKAQAAAKARGQTGLLGSIDRDLTTLENK